MGIGRWIAAGLGVAAVGAVAAWAQYRDIEKPSYSSVIVDGDFELRDYQPIIVAEVTHTGSRRNAQGASFRRLAAYIFGEDRPDGGEEIAMTSPVMTAKVDQNAKIAMTSPVVTQNTGGDTWRMRFVMPSEYTLETLPSPPEDITLSAVAGRRVAAVRFSGYGGDADLAKMEKVLREWIARQNLTPVGGVEYAFYDAPMIPGPLRRNEVMIEVATER